MKNKQHPRIFFSKVFQNSNYFPQLKKSPNWKNFLTAKVISHDYSSRKIDYSFLDWAVVERIARTPWEILQSGPSKVSVREYIRPKKWRRPKPSFLSHDTSYTAWSRNIQGRCMKQPSYLTRNWASKWSPKSYLRISGTVWIRRKRIYSNHRSSSGIREWIWCA